MPQLIGLEGAPFTALTARHKPASEPHQGPAAPDSPSQWIRQLHGPHLIEMIRHNDRVSSPVQTVFGPTQ